MTFYVVPIIEGQTEANCIERLLQRLWVELLTNPIRMQVLQPSRGHRDRLLSSVEPDLANKIEEANAKLGQRLRRESSSRGLLLVMIDAESDCPKELAPQLLQRGQQARPDADIACVLPKRMLENWFVSAGTSLAGVNGLPADLQTPEKPEDCGGAAWLDKQLRKVNPRKKYKKTANAKSFVAEMDLKQCRANSPSFDKLCRELERRAAAMEQGTDNPSGSPTEGEVGTTP